MMKDVIQGSLRLGWAAPKRGLSIAAQRDQSENGIPTIYSQWDNERSHIADLFHAFVRILTTGTIYPPERTL